MNIWPFQWVSWNVDDIRESNETHTIGLGARLRIWAPNDPAWKAKAEWELTIDLILWRWRISGFVPHDAEAEEGADGARPMTADQALKEMRAYRCFDCPIEDDAEYWASVIEEELTALRSVAPSPLRLAFVEAADAYCAYWESVGGVPPEGTTGAKMLEAWRALASLAPRQGKI